MVRAGVVNHPQTWASYGYNETQNPPKRYRIIDLDSLTRLLGFENLQDFQSAHKRWIEASLSKGDFERQSDWAENIAVGGKSFIDKVKKRLGFKAKGRPITSKKNHYQLRENIADFGDFSSYGLEPDAGSYAGMDDTFFWNSKS